MVTLRITLPAFAVIGMEYQIAGEPIGWVSVTRRVSDPGTFTLDPFNPIVKLGDGELAVIVTGPDQ